MEGLSYMRRKKSTPTLWLLLISAITLCSITYAAVNGVITIGGVANVSSNTNIQITDAYSSNALGEYDITPDGQTLNFSVPFDYPGEYNSLTYDITNLGSATVKVYPPSVVYDPDQFHFAASLDDYSTVYNTLTDKLFAYFDFQMGMEYVVNTGEWGPNNEYVILDPGEVFRDCLNIEWPGNAIYMVGGNYALTATLDYEQYNYAEQEPEPSTEPIENP
jgi:hypothetical protein